MSLVYIIQAGEHVKIGVATNMASRLKGLSTGSALPLSVAHTRSFDTMETARQIEKRLHNYFYKARANGEWFKLSPAEAWEMLRAIKPLSPRRRTKAHRSDDRPTPEMLERVREALNAVSKTG